MATLSGDNTSHEADSKDGTCCSKSIMTMPNRKTQKVVEGRVSTKPDDGSAAADAKTRDRTKESRYRRQRKKGVQSTRNAKVTWLGKTSVAGRQRKRGYPTTHISQKQQTGHKRQAGRHKSTNKTKQRNSN